MNSKIDWFDDIEAEFWCNLFMSEIISMLGYDLGGQNLKVYWLLPSMDLSNGLRIVSSDEDTLIMKQVADTVKKFVVYLDHHYHVA